MSESPSVSQPTPEELKGYQAVIDDRIQVLRGMTHIDPGIAKNLADHFNDIHSRFFQAFAGSPFKAVIVSPKGWQMTISLDKGIVFETVNSGCAMTVFVACSRTFRKMRNVLGL